MMNTPMQQQVLYQADQGMVQSLAAARQHLHHMCGSYRNRPVRIQLVDGRTYEGAISHTDGHHLYLLTAHPVQREGDSRAFFYNNVILPLVLYELLVITLLYT